MVAVARGFGTREAFDNVACYAGSMAEALAAIGR